MVKKAREIELKLEQNCSTPSVASRDKIVTEIKYICAANQAYFLVLGNVIG
jgi:hypothetical protein